MLRVLNVPLLFVVTPEQGMEKWALKGDLRGRDEKVASRKAQPRAFRFLICPLKERPARSLVLTDSRWACYSTEVCSVFGMGLPEGPQHFLHSSAIVLA